MTQSHVYWRVLFQSGYVQGIELNEIEVYDVFNGDTNIAIGAYAFAGEAQVIPPQGTAKLNDGVIDTVAWTALAANTWGTTKWVGVQFSGAVAVKAIRLIPHWSITLPYSFDVQWSDDASAWTTISSHAPGANGWGTGAQVIAFFGGLDMAFMVQPDPSLGTGHRWWRIKTNSNQAGGFPTAISSRDYSFLISGSAIHSAHSTPAFASSVAYTTTGINRAADKVNDANSWISDTSGWPVVFGYDFGHPVSPGQLSITVDSNSLAPSDFEIQFSDDGSSWTTAIAYTPTGWANGETRVFDITQTFDMTGSISGLFGVAGTIAPSGGLIGVIPGRFGVSAIIETSGGSTPTDETIIPDDFDYHMTVMSQYANSPILDQLIDRFNDCINPTVNIKSFYDNIWNVETATGYGLDVWGRIVGVTRILNIPSGKFFGFTGKIVATITASVSGTALTISAGATSSIAIGQTVMAPGIAAGTRITGLGTIVGGAGLFQVSIPQVTPSRTMFITTGASGLPFGQAPLYSGTQTTSNFIIGDDLFRKMIMIKALANISAVTIKFYNKVLMQLFAGRGNCYVSDTGNMCIRFTFEFSLEPWELALLRQSGIFSTPAGVKTDIFVYHRPRTFGFNEAGAGFQGFNNGSGNGGALFKGFA